MVGHREPAPSLAVLVPQPPGQHPNTQTDRHTYTQGRWYELKLLEKLPICTKFGQSHSSLTFLQIMHTHTHTHTHTWTRWQLLMEKFTWVQIPCNTFFLLHRCRDCWTWTQVAVVVRGKAIIELARVKCSNKLPCFSMPGWHTTNHALSNQPARQTFGPYPTIAKVSHSREMWPFWPAGGSTPL